MLEKIKLRAPAKINLNLHVSAPIKEGQFKNYHSLDSLVVFADFGDELSFANAPENHIEIIGEFGDELLGADFTDNLIFKAIEALNSYCETNHCAHVTLDKKLPIASGIGGGSSDCAASLLALNEIWELGLSIDQLIEIGNKIGADIGVCLAKIPKIMRGIGNELQDAPKLPNLAALLVNPLLPCSTIGVYKCFDEIGDFNPDLDAKYHDCQDYSQAIEMLGPLCNDLTEAAIKNCPPIGEILEILGNQTEADLIRMSGSGATCFGIYKSLADANLAGAKIEEIYKNRRQKIWAKPCQLMGQ